MSDDNLAITPDLAITPALAPIRRQVEDRLRQAIHTGLLQAGTKLVERDLCARLGVSRTSLREALRQLEAEGLVNLVPYRGPEVAGLSMSDAEQIYQVRELLEGFAGQQFARLANEQQRADLESCFEEIRHIVRAGKYEQLIALKERFYEILLAGAGNYVARDTLKRLNGRVRRLRAVSLSASDRPLKTLEELDMVMMAIRARNGEQARLACMHHVQEAAKAAMRILHTQINKKPSAE